jgi:hypothetical protein
VAHLKMYAPGGTPSGREFGLLADILDGPRESTLADRGRAPHKPPAGTGVAVRIRGPTGETQFLVRPGARVVDVQSRAVARFRADLRTSKLFMGGCESVPENRIDESIVRDGTVSTLHAPSTSSQSLVQLPREVALVEGGRAEVGIAALRRGGEGTDTIRKLLNRPETPADVRAEMDMPGRALARLGECPDGDARLYELQGMVNAAHTRPVSNSTSFVILFRAAPPRERHAPVAVLAEGIRGDLDIDKTSIDAAIGAPKLLTRTVKLPKALAQFNAERAVTLVRPVLRVFLPVDGCPELLERSPHKAELSAGIAPDPDRLFGRAVLALVDGPARKLQLPHSAPDGSPTAPPLFLTPSASPASAPRTAVSSRSPRLCPPPLSARYCPVMRSCGWPAFSCREGQPPCFSNPPAARASLLGIRRPPGTVRRGHQPWRDGLRERCPAHAALHSPGSRDRQHRGVGGALADRAPPHLHTPPQWGSTSR